MNFFIAFMALNVLIVIHELGHFMVAKWANIKVHEFALFMGPKIFSITKGETTYALRSIPIGGFVRMEGEDGSSKDERAFNNKSIGVRALVIFAGPLMNILFSVIVLSCLFYFNGFQGNSVGMVQEGSAAMKAGIQKGDKIVKYDGNTVYIPLDYYTYMLVSKGKPVDIEINRNGINQKMKIAPIVYPKNRYLLGFSAKETQNPETLVVESVPKDAKVVAKGLEPGDRIKKINDTPINNLRDSINFLQKNGDQKVIVTVDRKGIEVPVELQPKQSVQKEDYETGLLFANETGSVVGVTIHSFKYVVSMMKSVVYGFYWMSNGSIPVSEMRGPVGIVTAVGDVVKESVDIKGIILNLLSFSALISIAIGGTNLLPIPPLDGSRLLLIAVEAVRRKPLAQEQEAMIAMFGFVLIILVSIFVFYNDIMRFFVR